MGAGRVISVVIPNQEGTEDYGNMFSVVSRCFQLMSARTEHSWRRYSNVVISPPVADLSWDSFRSASRLIELGEQSAMAAMPAIKKWLAQPLPVSAAKSEREPSALPSPIRSA
jgi:predicted acylesterase/phospholipase RssA